MRKFTIHHILILLFLSILFDACNKTTTQNQVQINSLNDNQQLRIILLLGDGMGIPQLTAAWHEHQYLNLQRFPYSGLMLTHAADKFVTGSAASATAMMSGEKTNYHYLGIDPDGNSLESIYDYLKKQNYKTGIISTSYITDATLAALYTHRADRTELEEIAMDFYHDFPDFTFAGGKDNFDQRDDQLNLMDSLAAKGVHILQSSSEISQLTQLPALGLVYPLRPPFLLEGRDDFLMQASKKALSLFENKAFFLFIEGGQIDWGGHNKNIEEQVSETLEFDEVCGMALDYASQREHVLVLVVADHECGALSLLQGEGNEYIPNYAVDEHSGNMVAVFAYGYGASNFTGIMDNTEIYDKLKYLIDQNLSK